MLKLIVITLFLLMFASLILGGKFLLTEHSNSRRLLASLKVRVVSASLLVIVLFYGFYTGQLG